MNKERRKLIQSAISEMEELRSRIETIQSLLAEAKDGEEEYRDNMPESLQSSEKYGRAETAVNNLETVADALNEIDIDDFIGQLEEAAE